MRPLVTALLAGFVGTHATPALGVSPDLGATALGVEKPNFIFILADDVGYGDLGCFGQEHFTTPRLDQMAAEGMRFTQHYAGSTVCAPSRACLLTGQHTGHVYQRMNGPVGFRDDPLDITIATRLQSAGYHTAMIGKSGLACLSEDAELPSRKGFNHFFGYLDHAEAHRYYPERLYCDGEKVEYPGNHGYEGDTYSGDEFLADTLRYLDERGADSGTPFFLHLSLQQSHADLSVPDEWRQKFIGKYEEPTKLLDRGGYRPEPNPKATYAAMMAYLDHSIGKVLDKLQEAGLAENTLVIFASDNGAMSEGGWSREFFNSSGPLRGGKRDMYEGGVRTPMIAWWPGVVAAGGESDHVSAFWDFAPTACELAGLPAPAETDGVSYAPTLRGEDNAQRQHDYLYWEFYEQGGKQAVRLVGRSDGQWKGVRLNVSKNPNGPIELYELGSDLGEEHNLAAEHPEIVAEIAAAMSEAHTASPIARLVNRGRRGR